MGNRRAEAMDDMFEAKGRPFYHQVAGSGTIIFCDINFSTDKISIKSVELDCKELQTPGLPAASDGQVITKEVNFYSKVGGTILHVELILTFDTRNPEESLESDARILST